VSPAAVLRAAAALVAASSFQIACAQAPAEGDLVIERGHFILDAARIPPLEATKPPVVPSDASPWEPVTLPDNWYLSRPGARAVGWYRLEFELSEAETRGTHSVQLAHNSAKNIAFFANGRRVGATGGYGDPGSRNWAPPVVLSLPAAYLKPGRNILHVRVEALPELRQGLARVLIGGLPTTRHFYEARFALQVTTLFMFGAAALLSGLLALAFWARERADATLLWFAVTAFAWSAAASPWISGGVAPPQFWHGPIAFVARFAYAVPMLVLCLRAAGQRRSLGEAAFWAFTATGAVLIGLIGEEREGFLITYWSAAYLAALLALLVVLIWRQRRQRGWSSWVLAASLVLAVILDAHDFFWWLGWIDYDSLKLAHFAVPLVLFAIGATIVDRHFRAVTAVERAKLELEGRVAEKAREIEANYASVQEAEREKALARERQRIMADMHDGLGSSLVALLAAVQSGVAPLREVERRLHDALQELRLAVDALEPTDGDLNVILGSVRHRMRTAIESSGVRFHWQVGELPQLPSLTPKAVLAIQRIVLEALTNSLRHARATDVTVRTQVNGSSLQIGVSDDGVGFDEASVTPGRGLENLRQRARGLGGSVQIRSSRGAGTDVTLRLPLDTP
jgi:signal transduction histidine kinase